MRALLACSCAATVIALASVASGKEEEKEEELERPPLAESLLTESATDLDATEAGEVEVEGNFTTLGARSGGAHAIQTSLEVEWRVLREVGVRLEPSFVHTTSAASESRFGVDSALAFGLFHDFAHDFHLQAELLARTSSDVEERVLEPGNPELPYAADLLAAWRVAAITLRATIGAEAGGDWAHAPMHTDLAVLTSLVGDERFGFVGIEARADWARQAPFVIAPDFVSDVTPIGLPFRIGVALPVSVGGDATAPSYGLFVRVMLLTAREVDYGRTGGAITERSTERK